MQKQQQTVHFIGDPQTRGVYFWYSKHYSEWIICDLDLTRCKMYDELVTIEMGNGSNLYNDAIGIALGSEKNVDFSEDVDVLLLHIDDLITILHEDDYEEIKILTMYRNNGKEVKAGKHSKKLIQSIRRTNI